MTKSRRGDYDLLIVGGGLAGAALALAAAADNPHGRQLHIAIIEAEAERPAANPLVSTVASAQAGATVVTAAPTAVAPHLADASQPAPASVPAATNATYAATATTATQAENADSADPVDPLDVLDSRVYALSAATVKALSELGVMAHIPAARQSTIQRMDVRGDGYGRLLFSAYECGADQLSHVIESRQIAAALRGRLQQCPNVDYYYGQRPVQLQRDVCQVRLQLSSGICLTGALIVGADGRDSWVRQSAELDDATHDYQSLAVVANFRCEKSHQQTAFQWFRRDGILAYLPLHGQRMSMVWSTSPQVAAELVQLPLEQFAERVAAAGNYVLGKLDCITPPRSFPLRFSHVPRIIDTRLALIGDAAHAIHPLSGHGFNLGMQDSQSLAMLCRQFADTDIGSPRLLVHYQQLRQENIRVMLLATHQLQRLFSTDIPAVPLARNLGMQLVNRWSPLKKQIIHYALST